MVVSIRLLVALVLLAISIAQSVAVRTITEEELATKTSKTGTGDVIWLSIMGEVYDVSAGLHFYEEGNGYSIFAGRDGSVPFITGEFNPDGAAQTIEILTNQQIGQLDEWRQFYVKEEKYPFVGLLEGYLYTKEGNPTEFMKKIQVIAEEEKVLAEERAKDREMKIAARREKRAKEKAQKEAKNSEL
jgi:predicted heme/steroid binding protein